MNDNCLARISNHEFITLSNLENSEKFYKFKTEYKIYLKSLDKRSLENEWSQNLDLLNNLKYTYNFVKSYYYTNVFNVAKYIEKDDLYCHIQEYTISKDAKENLIRISKYVKTIIDYLDAYLKDITRFNAEYPTRVFMGNSKRALFIDTYNVAYECYCFFDRLNSFNNILTSNYYFDMYMLDPSKLSKKDIRDIKNYPQFVVGKKPEDRILYYSMSEEIFEIVEIY